MKNLRPGRVTLQKQEAKLRNLPLKTLLKECKKCKPEAQEALYRAFYGYAMSISLRYAYSREQAQEIVNDAFLKAFANLSTQRNEASFKSWLRRILINTAIDYHRQYEKHYYSEDIVDIHEAYQGADGLDDLSEQELTQLIQALPPAYRISFNLYVIEGYKHHEIARKLGITVGTSKSNLAKARKHLKRMLEAMEHEKTQTYG